MKRTADRQITKDDQGNEGSDGAASDADAAPVNDTGDYRASAEVMARRRVVRAKRNDDGSWKNKASAATATTAAAAASSSAANEGQLASNGDAKVEPVAATQPPTKSNPFAGIQLVASAAPATTTTSSSSTNGTQEEPTKSEPSEVGIAGAAAAAQTAAHEGGGAAGASEPPPKKAATIFGSTSGFSGFGSVAKASGFAGFNTLPATTGGFGSAAAASAESGASAAPKSSVFGGLAGFSGFATAANAAGGGFTFGKPAGASTDHKLDAAANATGEPSPSSKENTESVEGDAAGAAAEEASSDSSPVEMASPQPKQGPLLPTEYELVSGEEAEKIVLELRCRTYRWGPQQLKSDTHKAGSDSKRAAVLSVPPSASSSAFAKDSATAADEASSSKEAGDDQASSSGLVTSHAETSQPACMWREAGIGPLRILLNPATNALRLVQRRESTINGPATKVVWNVSLWKESVVKPLGDRHVQISSFLGRGQPVLILCKCATPTNAADLLALLESRLPNLRSAEAATAATKTTDAETTETTASDAAVDVPGTARHDEAT